MKNRIKRLLVLGILTTSLTCGYHSVTVCAEVSLQERASIDEQNAAIEAYNQAEDSKAAAIRAENEQIQSQYDKDYAQYKQDLDVYKQKEEKILGAGYESVEQYNDIMNDYYNNPYAAAEEKNVKEENTFDIDKSYIIEKGEETEETYLVKITHNFLDGEEIVKSYTTEFRINKNDIITLFPAGTQLKTYQNQYHYGFFANTNEDHIYGYWQLGGDRLEYLCNYKVDSWDTGTVYTLSYKDGQRASGDTDIEMVYNYSWVKLRKVATYNKPQEPKLELKEEYIPIYKEKLSYPEEISPQTGEDLGGMIKIVAISFLVGIILTIIILFLTGIVSLIYYITNPRK